MRVKAIAGVAAIWLGGAMTVRSLSTTELAISQAFLASTLGGALVVLSGVWLVVSGERLPEDTGQTLVPRRLVWYSTAAFMAVGATIYTGELLGLVEL